MRKPARKSILPRRRLAGPGPRSASAAQPPTGDSPSPDSDPSERRSGNWNSGTINTSGSHSPGCVGTTGPNSPIHIGRDGDHEPPTERKAETSWGQTWPLKLISFVGLLSEVCTVTGLNLGKIDFQGLKQLALTASTPAVTAQAEAEAEAGTQGQRLHVFMPWIAFSVSVLTFVSPFMFLAAVRARGYLWAGMGKNF